ncbi:hypothetical protein AYI70_g8416 [Smittium culicis]|uniref:RNA-directed DNA polymerase from mobile element jockey n=1 Tax=Smittium culicis TaxID=133412 RepID=A0A1R1XG35_9FUNG|nr:hypothetical protein AYI70_g8416 [Smittium culicis]
MTTSIIVPVPKKGDIKDPDNYRGISLIPTIIKLLAKIVATKLAPMNIKYKMIAKEKADFRKFEECVAQVTTLYEIARRRKIDNKETWLCNIEYSKAYGRVPHMDLLLPFADDAVLLAESSADLQDSLNTITVWSDTWEMAVNASKCGVMTISGELTTDMTLQGQKFNPTDQYTYLGYIMNSKKAVYAAYSFLRRSDVLTALKIKFINSVLMPIGCYGGETFGMSESRCKPIQSEIDKAIRMVANVGKSAAMERISDELGITSVFMHTSTACERAYYKCPTSITWIADLIKAPMKAQMATWVTGSTQWIK